MGNAIDDNVPSAEEMFESIPQTNAGAEATRVSGANAIQQISKLVPHYISGSADLHSSCRNYIEDGGNFGTGFDKTYSGKNLYFGIREHSMGSILNGIAYHGLFKASGSTFCVFVDYFRPTIRVAALAELNRVSYILTHDSIGVGEDGPTHQPVETVSGLRVFPNLDVYRPGDAEETVAAFVSSVTRKEGPTALIFSRQGMEQNDAIPCMSAYERQTDEYKESVLPSTCTKRIAMEAGVSGLWYKYASKVIGVDRFGFSAPGDIVMEELGMTYDNLKAQISSMN